MFFNTLQSEWTKLRSTASFWWTTSLVFILCLGVSALMAAGSNADDTGMMGMDPLSAVFPYTLVGLAVVLIQAIMLITTEYRFGIVPQNFLAAPNRWRVILAKYVLYAVISAIIAFLVVIASWAVAGLILSDTSGFHPFSDGRRAMWAFPLGTVVAVLLVQGIGLLVRQTAGAVAITIIWLLGFDQLLAWIPKIGDDIARVMPFRNLSQFFNDMPYNGTEGSSWVPLGVAALWAVGLWVLGLVLVLRRDA